MTKHWSGGEAVTQRSAKPRYAGSIPARTSKQKTRAFGSCFLFTCTEPLPTEGTDRRNAKCGNHKIYNAVSAENNGETHNTPNHVPRPFLIVSPLRHGLDKAHEPVQKEYERCCRQKQNDWVNNILNNPTNKRIHIGTSIQHKTADMCARGFVHYACRESPRKEPLRRLLAY